MQVKNKLVRVLSRVAFALALITLWQTNAQAQFFLKQSTAIAVPICGVTTDGTSEKTDLAVTAANIKISKAGGSLSAKNDSTDLTHLANDCYTVTLNATDTNTLGTLMIKVHTTDGAVAELWIPAMVLAQASYDLFVGGQVSLAPTNWADDAIDANGRRDISKVNGVAINNLVSGKVDAYSSDVLDILEVYTGTAQAGANTTITLSSGASATTNLYAGAYVKIVSGIGAGQIRLILSYNGSTKVATVDRRWATNPDNTSVFVVIR